MALRATQTFFVGNVKIHRGQLVNPRDPIVQGRRHLFEDGGADVPFVEQATSAPGERRRVRLPGRPTAAPAGGLTVAALRRSREPQQGDVAPVVDAEPETE